MDTCIYHFDGTIPNKEIVGNVVKVKSKQEEIESKKETGGEIIESRVKTEVNRTGYNMETKKCLQSWDTNEKRKRNAQVVRRHSPRITNGTT